MNQLFSRQSILVWIIIVLAVTNISTIATIIYHRQMMGSMMPMQNANQGNEMQNFNGRYFRDKLNFSSDQMQLFRQINKPFRMSAMEMTNNLGAKRIELLDEMKKQKPDTSKLNFISKEIGQLHTNLKIATYKYYFDMKDICNAEQTKLLDTIFSQMFKYDLMKCMQGKGQNM